MPAVSPAQLSFYKAITRKNVYMDVLYGGRIIGNIYNKTPSGKWPYIYDSVGKKKYASTEESAMFNILTLEGTSNLIVDLSENPTKQRRNKK